MAYGNRFLDSLPGPILKRLGSELNSVKLTVNECLYLADQQPRWIYFPTTAVISKFQILEDGQTIEGVLTANDGVIGLASAVGSPGAINCSQVLVSGAGYTVPIGHFEDLLKCEPLLGAQSVSFLNAQMRQMSQRLICNSFHSVEQRLCRWLLVLANMSGNLQIKLTHEQCARALGVHRPTITACAMGLRDREIIAHSRGRLKILDARRMEKLACQCHWGPTDLLSSNDSRDHGPKAKAR